MSYKIAVASSDGVHIDFSFGGAKQFRIYEAEGPEYRFAETRNCESYMQAYTDAQEYLKCGVDTSVESVQSCDSRNPCMESAEGTCGTACGGKNGAGEKVNLIADCRCVVCRKIGFHVQKQLEKLAVIGFDVDCSVDEALQKITQYLVRVDGHISLRGIQGNT